MVIFTNLKLCLNKKNNNNIVSLDVLKKVEELFVGLHSDNSKYNKNLQDILGEKSNYDH